MHVYILIQNWHIHFKLQIFLLIYLIDKTQNQTYISIWAILVSQLFMSNNLRDF